MFSTMSIARDDSASTPVGGHQYQSSMCCGRRTCNLHTLAAEADRPRAGGLQPCECLDDCALSCSLHSDEGDDLAGAGLAGSLAETQWPTSSSNSKTTFTRP